MLASSRSAGVQQLSSQLRAASSELGITNSSQVSLQTSGNTAQLSPREFLTHNTVSKLKWLFYATRFWVLCYTATVTEQTDGGKGFWVFLLFLTTVKSAEH